MQMFLLKTFSYFFYLFLVISVKSIYQCLCHLLQSHLCLLKSLLCLKRKKSNYLVEMNQNMKVIMRRKRRGVHSTVICKLLGSFKVVVLLF